MIAPERDQDGSVEGPASPPTRRAVETLRALSVRPLSHSEVARRVGMAPATTHAVLTELVACGWVTRDEDSRLYRLGQDLLDWAGELVQPETRIRDVVQSLAATLGLPVLFGQLQQSEQFGPTLVVRDTSAFIPSRYEPVRSIELPFSAPFGSIIAAHGSEELRAAWLPRDADLARAFREKLDGIARAGYSVESYGPHVVQLLTLLRSSVPDFGREQTAVLADDLLRLVAQGDLEQAGRYPVLVSVPVATGGTVPGSLTVQMRSRDDSPEPLLAALRESAAHLERLTARPAS